MTVSMGERERDAHTGLLLILNKSESTCQSDTLNTHTPTYTHKHTYTFITPGISLERARSPGRNKHLMSSLIDGNPATSQP